MKVITFNIMGRPVDFPEKKDCDWCGAKETAELDVKNDIPFYAPQPCSKCRKTKKYKKLEEQRKEFRSGSIDEALKTNKPAAVFQGKGREIVVNHKGDVIANVPFKPRPEGVKDWGHF